MSTTELSTVKKDEPVSKARQWRRPRYDIFENEDAFEVTAYLPGFGRDEIDVSVDGNALKLITTRLSDSTEGWRSLRQELPRGDFRLSLSLNVPINQDTIEACAEDGILTLTLPKADAYKTRKITINS